MGRAVVLKAPVRLIRQYAVIVKAGDILLAISLDPCAEHRLSDGADGSVAERFSKSTRLARAREFYALLAAAGLQ